MRKEAAGTDLNQNNRKPTKTLPAALLIGCVSLFATGLSIYTATEKANAISVDRQIEMMERSVGGIVRRIALEQEVVAVWDDAIEKLRERDLDEEWFDNNFGPWMTTTYGHDETYVLRADGKPVYASVSGERTDPSAFAGVRTALLPILNDLRKRTDTSGEDEEVYLTSGRAVFEARLVVHQDRPAAVSAMRIVPESDRMQRDPAGDPVFISVRYLDRDFLTSLSRSNLIEGLHYSPTPNALPREVAVPLAHGSRQVGYLVWTPERPGSRILATVVPVAGLGYALVFVALAAFATRLDRTVGTLACKLDELRESKARACHAATHDALTGLPNRALLAERLAEAVQASDPGSGAAVAIIDLDRFKRVNDTLGHHAGDLLIREVAGRLRAIARDGDTVARFGGDEFVFLRLGIVSSDDAKRLCEQIAGKLAIPCQAGAERIDVGASIGVAVAPRDADDPGEILRKADIALYCAKERGRGRYALFSEEMARAVLDRSQLEDDLRAALADPAGLEVHYQPILRADGSTLAGFEALARWTHPKRGSVPPDVFVPIAEEAGLIGALSDRVLREACRASRRWPGLVTAVNISPARLALPGASLAIVKAVVNAGADPSSIELEVTEGVFIGDGGAAAEELSRLRELGFKVALDDFGTGYSSLGYLSRMKVDKIKIDRSFVAALDREDTAVLTKAILSLAHAMGMEVVAEGVETEAQRQMLSEAGCDLLQGWLFSRAVSEHEAAELAQKFCGNRDLQRAS